MHKIIGLTSKLNIIWPSTEVELLQINWCDDLWNEIEHFIYLTSDYI